MTWRHWLGLLGAFATLKWVMGRYGEDVGAYVVVGLLAAILLIGYLLHAHRQHMELTVAQAEPEERARLLAALPPAQAAALRFSVNSLDDLDTSAAPPAVEFSYPPASRGLTRILFWASVLCTVGLLLPILGGGPLERSTAIGLIASAGVFIVAALGYKLGHRWAGLTVRVDAEGLTETDPTGQETQLPWNQLARVTYRRWSGVVEYEGSGGQQIRVGTTLIDFAYFVQLTLIHRFRASRLGAA
jgi:YD repeat-containing protein